MIVCKIRALSVSPTVQGGHMAEIWYTTIAGANSPRVFVEGVIFKFYLDL